MLTPDQVTACGKAMQRLCGEFEREAAAQIPEFLAFLKNPGVSKADKKKALKKYRRFLTELTARLRKRSNQVLIETVRTASKSSLRADRKLAEEALDAGADLGDGGNG